MAALPESPDLRVVDLRHITTEELNPILAEEAAAWRSKLHWDISPSVDLVQRYVRMQALTGYALLRGGRTAGYLYFVHEDHKAIIGDLYVLEKERTAEAENVLLQAALEMLWRVPGLRRVEAQFLLSSVGGAQARQAPYAGWLTRHPRVFMEIGAAEIVALKARSLRHVSLQPWSAAYQDTAAWLIASAYRGHVDSQINDQYRSPEGARRFLSNIVQYPGCGVFFADGSYVANEANTGGLCGIALASMVAEEAGHITQLCVSENARGKGVGYELMRRALMNLAAHGARTVSLTVTAANHDAIRVYEQMGFRAVRQFPAHVWNF